MLLKYFSKVSLILFLAFNFCDAQEKRFNLNLDQCLKIAYENNKTLLQLHEKINSAKYQIDEAKSGFYPQLSFSGSYTRLGEVPSFDIGGMGKAKLGTENNYNLRLSYQQPLFTWGKIRAGYDISKYYLSLTGEEYRKTKQEIKFNLVNLFCNILLAEELS